MIKIEDIQNYEGQIAKISFDDGCKIKLKIIDTSHLEDGGDVVADVIEYDCSLSHIHHEPGQLINFKIEDVTRIEYLHE